MVDALPRRAGDRGKAAPFQRRLVIMVKEPVAGRVKTRLAREVGTATALRFYRANMSAAVRRLATDPRWQTVLSVAPAAALDSRHLPADMARTPQSDGDIGKRMQKSLAAPLGRNTMRAPGPVVLIGSDIPAVRPRHIAHAFRLLARNDIVFGPADDGGFWLVGLRRTPRVHDAFPRPVAWSAPDTLAECLDALVGRTVGFVETLSDTDTAADLARLGAASGRLILPK